VPLHPLTRYHFAAYIRTAGITTDSGVRFAILGTTPPVILDSNVGDKDWTLEQTDFTTSAGVSSVTIVLVRLPSHRFDNKLMGTVWVDDVTLVPSQLASALP
jgi:hypothetical protein